MRQMKRCNSIFNQCNSSSCGERIRVNQCDGGMNSSRTSSCCQCQNTCRPKPCPPRPCPRCEDRCHSQYCRCMRNCRLRENQYDDDGYDENDEYYTNMNQE